MKLIKLFSLLIAMMTTLSAQTENLALDGYCPVCYVAAGKANKGTAEFSAVHNEKTYYFVNAATKAMFVAEPGKFLPQYDGLCAYGVALGKQFKADPTVFSVVDGKVYLNKDAKIGEAFKKDQKALIVKAEANWPKVKKEMMLKKEEIKK